MALPLLKTAAVATTAIPLLTGLISKLGSAARATAKAREKTAVLDGNTSLTEFTNITRNDFLTLVEDDLLNYGDLSAILDRLQTMASGYYLSAVSLLVDVPNVDVIGKLDQLSANRGGHKMTGKLGKTFGAESIEYGLPPLYIPKEKEIGVGCEEFIGLEAPSEYDVTKRTVTNKTDKDGNVTSDTQVTLEPKKTQSKYQSDYKNLQTIEEQSNLATGKLLQVTFEQDGTSTTVQVQIRLSVLSTDSKSMTDILTFGGDSNSFIERYYRMRAGEIAFWKDLVFQNDLIEQAMQARARDKSGFFRQMMQRRVGNTLRAASTKKPSLNNASAILVFTSETARDIEDGIGGELESFKVRQQVFKSTSAMLMAVVDRRWNTVTIYHRGLNTYTELSIRDIKRSKGGTNDVDDALRSYIEGTAPAI